MPYVKETTELVITLQSDLITQFTLRIKSDSEIGTDLVFHKLDSFLHNFLYLYKLNYLIFFMWILLLSQSAVAALLFFCFSKLNVLLC